MKEKKKIGRREFLKVAGTGAAVTTAALYGCKPRSAGSASEADGARQGQMTYRTNPKTGDRVSLLGYGCMRWPTVSGSDDIDQEMVNALVDHAIAHGVNYFDTSPAYCRGHSEHATGVALSRHPRDKYFIATKLSNFAPSTWSREASMAMYRNSFRELQVDYIDYLLLHGVGMGSGMEEFEARYIDNGMLDFLLAEREAGRIRNLGFSYHGDIAVFDHLLAQHDRYKWDFVQIQLNYVDWKHAKEVNTRNTDAEYLYGELENRLEPLEQQAGKAKRFLHLRDELRVLEVSLWLLSLEQLKNDTAKLNKDRTTCEKQLADAKQQQGTLYAQSEQLAESLREIDRETNVCETSCAKPSSLPPSRSAVRRLFRRTSATARRISSAHGRRVHTAPSRCRAWMRSLPNGASVFLR